MKITALEEYGLRCLLRVAERDGDEPLSAREIAEMEGLSLPYAQKLMRTLSESGLVEARRGPHGGYLLADAPENISLGDVMRELGGMLQLEEFCDSHTGNREVCAHACDCSIRPIWSHISDFLIQTFDRIPLSVLVEDETAVQQLLNDLDPHEESSGAPPIERVGAETVSP